MLATIPPPPFRNLEVGPLTLHGYGLTMGIAIIVALSVCEWGLQRLRVDTGRFTPLVLLSVLGGFVGARLYHVASEPRRFAAHPEDIPAIWEGGLGIYGAVAGGALVGLTLSRRFGVPRAAFADVAAPALLIAQAIGRLGNYLNQELFGRPLDTWWALEVDREHRPTTVADAATFHPTFLYEALLNLVLFAIFLVLFRRWTRRAPGVLLPLYVAAYSGVRLVVEPLRIDEANEWFGVRQNVWVAATLLVCGLAVAVWMQRRYAGSPTAGAGAGTASDASPSIADTPPRS